MLFDKIQSEEDLIELIIKPKRSESHYLEYKRELEKKPKSLTKAVTAFANASGGLLFFGIEEDENHLATKIHWLQIGNNQHTIENLILDYIQPKFPHYRIKPIHNSQDPGLGVFLVAIERGLNGPYMNSEKIHYIRRDKKSEPMNAQEIREAMFRVGLRNALIEELNWNLEHAKQIENQRQKLQEATPDTNPPLKSNGMHIYPAIIPFRTEAWKAVAYSGFYSLFQEKFALLIKLYNLIFEINYLIDYLKYGISRVQTQEHPYHENLMFLTQGKCFTIKTTVETILKRFKEEI